MSNSDSPIGNPGSYPLNSGLVPVNPGTSRCLPNTKFCNGNGGLSFPKLSFKKTCEKTSQNIRS